VTLRFTTSWDDGHPLDLRVADILAARGVAGTFYVPRFNREGRSVLTKNELRTLGKAFEIGGHSIDHVPLAGLPVVERDRQLCDGKRRMEDELGHPILGFSYPGGVHDPDIRAAVRAAGFRYARTITNLSLEPARDRYQIDTTLQLYPHSRLTYLKNFAWRGHWRTRASPLTICLGDGSLDRCLEIVSELLVQILFDLVTAEHRANAGGRTSKESRQHRVHLESDWAPRVATRGDRRDARRAGSQQAASTVAPSSVAMMKYVVGSIGSRLKSRPRTSCDNATEPIMPSPAPIAASLMPDRRNID